jgi:hypothetical protein
MELKKRKNNRAKEVVYICRLLQELNVLPSHQVPISCTDGQIHMDLKTIATPTKAEFHLLCNNQVAVKLDQNSIFHAKTKHIEAKNHFIREHVLEGEIALDYIHTDSNPANLLTKALPRPKFEQYRHTIRVRTMQEL